MSLPEVVDLSSDDESGDAQLNLTVKQEPGLVVKQEPDINVANNKYKKNTEPAWAKQQRSHSTWQESPANRSSNAVQSSSSIVRQVVPASATNGSGFATKLPPAPLPRQFWKAGNYDDAQTSKVQPQAGQNHLRVHPKFLHSNATSHKWAFGAIAELLDNAFDEVQNGASFVEVDKIINPKDGCPALLIHDDGGGMDPESIRRCMSFGFSAKKSKTSIGQYGNGFKTSTMRLGADVIVFSRHMSKRTLTQSIGLLSYTFLRQTGHDRIVVPMVDYEFEESTGKLKRLGSYSAANFSANLSMLLQWSPYGTEAELLKQFDNMGHHGTKVIIYNLWFSDDGDLEFDFESDPEDILISGAPKIINSSHQGKMISQQHIANRYLYSLRVYSSILYLRVPENFKIILRGQVVGHHNLADDLRFSQYIYYKPQIGGLPEAATVTTIGFLKDAPHVNIHGFNIYHKNRLIMPFLRVVSQTNSRGRGVAGVLEANFIEPTHNKQDFEKTNIFQKLEARLKDMTLEYWDFHCHLIGYQQLKKTFTSGVANSKVSGSVKPVMLNTSSPVNSMKVASTGREYQNSKETLLESLQVRQKESVSNKHINSPPGITLKRKGQDDKETQGFPKQAKPGENATDSGRHHWEARHVNDTDKQSEEIIQENKKLRAQCLEYEKEEEDLNNQVELLKIELLEVQHEYARLLSEVKAMEAAVKEEKL